MKKKNKKKFTGIKSKSREISKYIQQQLIKKVINEKPKASIKRYGRVIKEIGQVLRSSETGRFVSVSNSVPKDLKTSKAVRVRSVKTCVARSTSTGKKGTRIGGPKRK